MIELILEAAPAAVAAFDAEGRCLRANSSAQALLGSASAPAISREGLSLVRRVLASGTGASTTEIVADGGDDVAVHWLCCAMRDADATVTGALLIGDDSGRTARLEKLARTDPLTGVLNRGAFEDQLNAEVELATRHGVPLSLALLDVDDFKSINDTFGHQVGDQVLIDVIAIICEHVRASDLLGRIGGDEFAILMPHTDARGAAVIAGRAHGDVGAAIVAGGHRVTLSIGVADLEEGEGPEGLFGRADQGLYASKTHGRDMVWRYRAGDDTLHQALLDGGKAVPLARGQAAAAVRALARAIDLKDPATRQHSDRVAEVAVRLAACLGWSSERRELIRQAAVIHDVGKVAVPDTVLLKPQRLTDSEYELVQAHAALGAQIAGEVLTPEQIGWVRSHHERFDGTGYPDGLADDDIPEGAQILAAADAFDVMVSERPYASGRDPLEALDELRRCAGTQFAWRVVDAFSSRQFVRFARIHSNEERARAANRDPPRTDDGYLLVRCECGAGDCTASLRLTSDELSAAHSHQRRFVIADGHEFVEVERVVARTPRFIVVEKRI